MTSNLALFLAQGLGIGRIPFAPGTFGSFLGFGWFLLIIAPGNAALFLTAILFSFFVSVWTSEEAEKILRQKDPGSVVVDEIIAIPICFLGWLSLLGELPPPAYFLTHWKTSLGIILAFRLFDIWKPTPIHQSQRFPTGWGITIDDVLAAIYVALLSAVFIQR